MTRFAPALALIAIVVAACGTTSTDSGSVANSSGSAATLAAGTTCSPGALNATMSVSPSSISVVQIGGQPNSSQVATLSITYANHTCDNLSALTLSLSPYQTGPTSGDSGVTFDTSLSVAAQGAASVFDLPALAAGQSATATIQVDYSTPGTKTVSGVIQNSSVKATVGPVTITAS